MPQRKTLVQSFIVSNFNYCPAIWHFCSERNKHKIEKIHERALRYVHADYESSYFILLNRSDSHTLELKRIQQICTEIYKILNGIGPKYMENIVIRNQAHYSSRRPLNLFVPRVNQTTFGLKSFRYQATLLWNSLPVEIKSADNLNTFKRLIKTWNGPSCRCNFCSFNREEN